jgi:Transposase zinc-ribbon domain
MDSTLNLGTLARHFSDEDAARAQLEETHWGKNCEHAACPHCGVMLRAFTMPRVTDAAASGWTTCHQES